ncbi:MAG TPA: hypothetical protein QGH10_14250 [Armatimonadota bacterium]|nr:hypothetical protein [Armatimonadota bacterium]
MSTRLMRIIACVVVLAIVCTLVIGTLGCSKKLSSEDKKMMNDPEAKEAKQKQMMQDMKKKQGATTTPGG